MDETGLFDAGMRSSTSDAGGRTVEQRLDDFANLAKETTQLAAKLRTSLNALAENARIGSVSAAAGQLAKLSEATDALSVAIGQLSSIEQSTGLRGASGIEAEYASELQAELARIGVTATRGPDPYWLVYPASFKVERNAKGSIEVTLNGEKLDTVRPTAVAEAIRDAAREKFDGKQFVNLLDTVRQLLRRVGAASGPMNLDDIYEVLAIEPGKRVARRKDFSKAGFYYSVHRLAEEVDKGGGFPVRFPPANRPDMVFFTKDGESRKYLAVEFEVPGLQ